MGSCLALEVGTLWLWCLWFHISYSQPQSNSQKQSRFQWSVFLSQRGLWLTWTIGSIYFPAPRWLCSGEPAVYNSHIHQGVEGLLVDAPGLYCYAFSVWSGHQCSCCPQGFRTVQHITVKWDTVYSSEFAGKLRIVSERWPLNKTVFLYGLQASRLTVMWCISFFTHSVMGNDHWPLRFKTKM